MKKRGKFSDDVIFKLVMDNKDICKGVLERILKVKIAKISKPETDKSVYADVASKSIIMDAYLEDDKNTIYDIEMQNVTTEKIMKRFRYYQSVMDTYFLKKGDDYDQLRKSIIIFICTQDPFKLDLPVYKFSHVCTNYPSLPAGDDTHWIIANASSFDKEKDQPLRNLLQYVCNEETNNDPFIEQIHESVLFNSGVWRDEMLTHDHRLEMDLRVKYRNLMEKELAEKIAEAKQEYSDELTVELAKNTEEVTAEVTTEVNSQQNALFGKLAEEGRLDDILRATKEPDYKAKLLKEYGIS